jgi:hypothetical protein
MKSYFEFLFHNYFHLDNWCSKTFHNSEITYIKHFSLSKHAPMPVAVRSKTVCGRSITVTAGSNPVDEVNVRLFCLLCVV